MQHIGQNSSFGRLGRCQRHISESWGELVEMTNHKFESDFETIEVQHKRLSEIIKKMYDSIVRGDEQNALAEVFDELICFMIYHFDTEEALFGAYDYPDYESHKKEHNELCRQILELQEQFNMKIVTITFEVMDFLTNWLEEHTAVTDSKFEEYMRLKR